MEESIKKILRHQYPEKYEELHEQTAKVICDLLGVSVSFPIETETEFISHLFSAYLTGQADVENRRSGLKGRTFDNWYKDNYKSNER